MKLTRMLDKVLILATIFMLSGVGGAMLAEHNLANTFAENEAGIFAESAEHFVTFYDDGEKLTVKTDAATVGEALERAGISINETDIVEPGLDTIIDSNFFINIHRSRPVVVRDGAVEKYVMTASYEPRTIAAEAGLTLYDGDEIAWAKNINFLEAGVATRYEITRNGGRTLTVEEAVDFATIEVKDYSLTPGYREVRQLGETGVKVLTYDVLYIDGVEVSRELTGEVVTKEPVAKIVAVGASEIERKPLTVSMGRNYYTIRRADGTVIERQETYYDLPMSGVLAFCGATSYSVRDDGVKVDQDGYVLVAANLSRYPRCSVVETSLGLGKVYDTGTFAATNPEQFDLATDWTNRNGV